MGSPTRGRMMNGVALFFVLLVIGAVVFDTARDRSRFAEARARYEREGVVPAPKDFPEPRPRKTQRHWNPEEQGE